MSTATAGRAWLPASTGLPSDRPPTKDELREAWRRQAKGVFEMTQRARGGDLAFSRANTANWILLLLTAGGFISGLILFPPPAIPGLVIALHIVAGFMLLAAQVTGPATMATDAMAEVTSKSAQAWASSPLPTSAWVAGKTAYYLQVQAMATMRVMPLVAASAMLGGLKLREAFIIALVGFSWSAISGVGVAAASLEARQNLAQRLAQRRSALAPAALGASPGMRAGAPPAAAFAIMQIALGVAGLFMALPFVLGANAGAMPAPAALIVAVLCVLSPIGAGASAYFPEFGIHVAGHHVPMWAISMMIAAAVAPGAIVVSRLRWRPPDGALGLGVRPSFWLAWTAIMGVGFAALSSSIPSAAVASIILPLATAIIPTLAAASTRLPDLAEDAPKRSQQILGLNRKTAEVHGLICLGLVTVVASLFAPAGLFANVPAIGGLLMLAVAVTPLVAITAAMGRESRKGIARLEAGVKERTLRPATLVFVGMIVLAFSPAASAMLSGMGLTPLAGVVDTVSLLCPLYSTITLGRDALGLQIPSLNQGVTVNAWIVIPAIAAQFGLAMLARWLEKRSAAKDDFVYSAPAPQD